MGVLTEVPDFRFFSTLPDLHDLLAEDPKATTNKIPPTFQDIIGKIFLKHKMTKDFGVIFVHRHFQMGENEILVETFSADQSISLTTPWMVQKCDQVTPGDLQWDSVAFEEHNFTIPQAWAFSSSDGSLKAYEYLSSPTILPNPPQDFVDDLRLALKQMNLDMVLGIRRLGSGGRIRYGLEITPDTVEANVTKFVDMAEKDVLQEDGCRGLPVMWAFDDDGNMLIVRECIECRKYCV